MPVYRSWLYGLFDPDCDITEDFLQGASVTGRPKSEVQSQKGKHLYVGCVSRVWFLPAPWWLISRVKASWVEFPEVVQAAEPLHTREEGMEFKEEASRPSVVWSSSSGPG